MNGISNHGFLQKHLRNIVFILMTVFIVVLTLSCGPEIYDEENRNEEPIKIVVSKKTKILNEKEVADYLQLAGFKSRDINKMICIAKYESAFRPDAVGKVRSRNSANGSRDVGLFQINTYWWLRSVEDGGCGVTEEQLFDPKINAECAYRILKRQGYPAWIAYRKHRNVCDRYVAKLNNDSQYALHASAN